MRLPTRTPAACASPARRASGLLLLVLSLCAAPALASRYVVDINGGGDFTTIQEAIDARGGEFRDTILVAPGAYDEALQLLPVSMQAYIVGVGGAAVTSVRTVVPPPDWSAETRIEGLTLTHDMTNTGDARTHYFSRCVFRARVTSNGGYWAANYRDCDFHARTYFYGYHGSLQPGYQSPPFEKLRFHGATLMISPNGNGTNAMRHCTFEGPADTLVFQPGEVDEVVMDQCEFRNAGRGLVYGRCSDFGDRVMRCTFEDIQFEGILHDGSDGRSSGSYDLFVSDSRFERCGTAIRWQPRLAEWRLSLTRDTVLASRGHAIVLNRGWGLPGISDCIIAGSGGHGLWIDHTEDAISYPARLRISGSTFSDNAGDGARIEDASEISWIYGDNQVDSTTITTSRFVGNGGAGLRLSVARWTASGCIAVGNAGSGIATTNTFAKWPCELSGNTSVLNGGDGFEVWPSSPGDTLVVARNLSVMNAGAGFRATRAFLGSFAFNDAWGNYAGQHVGPASPADSNLVVDPRFCDLSAGAAGLGLQQGSPCGPTGVYGLIGARGEECANTVAVGPGAPATLAFAVRPSVARGSVEFVAPAGTGEGRVELYDLAGRLVWRAALGPATGPVRWHGESERGDAAAGLYWARFTRGAERATRRLVWLE